MTRFDLQFLRIGDHVTIKTGKIKVERQLFWTYWVQRMNPHVY